MMIQTRGFIRLRPIKMGAFDEVGSFFVVGVRVDVLAARNVLAHRLSGSGKANCAQKLVS